MNIKVLGTGCRKCQLLERKVKELVEQNQINAVVEKVTDINEIISFGVMMTPGLVVEGVVKSTGIIPKDDQILTWLRGN